MKNQNQITKRRRKEKSEDGRQRKKKADDDNSIDNENWVQCERCLKWRLIPSVDNIPENGIAR